MKIHGPCACLNYRHCSTSACFSIRNIFSPIHFLHPPTSIFKNWRTVWPRPVDISLIFAYNDLTKKNSLFCKGRGVCCGSSFLYRKTAPGIHRTCRGRFSYMVLCMMYGALTPSPSPPSRPRCGPGGWRSGRRGCRRWCCRG